MHGVYGQLNSAAPLGLEPRLPDPKSGVLPLNDWALTHMATRAGGFEPPTSRFGRVLCQLS